MRLCHWSDSKKIPGRFQVGSELFPRAVCTQSGGCPDLIDGTLGHSGHLRDLAVIIPQVYEELYGHPSCVQVLLPSTFREDAVLGDVCRPGNRSQYGLKVLHYIHSAVVLSGISAIHTLCHTKKTRTLCFHNVRVCLSVPYVAVLYDEFPEFPKDPEEPERYRGPAYCHYCLLHSVEFLLHLYDLGAM